MKFDFTSELWVYGGTASWYFITLPKDISDDIKALTKDQRNGFGSVKVSVSIGNAAWKTSIFPDSKSGCYILPVKKDIRTLCNLNDGDSASVSVNVLELL